MRQLAILGAFTLALTLPACGSRGADSPSAASASDSGSPSEGTTDDAGVGVDAAGPLGPTIECGNPTDGAMLNAAPGSSVAFGGTATGPNGVASVTVNGATATLSGTTFTANLTTRFGINFANVVATDTQGAVSTRICSFLAADQWAPENTLYADTVDLKLTQGAIDEGNRSNGVHSLADVLYAMINTPVVGAAEFAFSTMNPVISDACGQVCAPPIPYVPPVCVCAYSVGVNLLDLSLPGPQSVSLTLVDGGIQAAITVPSVGLEAQIYGAVLPGTIVGVPFDLSGWVTASDVTATMIFDVSLSNGQLQLSIRPNASTLSVGSFSTEIPGLDGLVIDNVVAILDQLYSFVRGYLQSTIDGAVDDYVSGPIGGILNGFVLSTFGTTQVPNFAGSGSPTPVSFNFGLTSVSTTSSEMLLGIATEFSSPATETFPSLGIPIPDGTVLDDIAVNAPSSAGVGVHVGVLNQALHAAWRGGMLSTTVTGANFGNGLLPAAAQVQLVSQLPPVADLVGNSVELSLGSLELQVNDPGLTGEANGPPLAVEVGARLALTPMLNGNSLQYTNAALTELHFSTGDIALDPTSQQVLQSLLQNLVPQLALQSLNALPALPVPSFVMTAAVQAELPSQFGPTNLSLGYDTNDFVLAGQLGPL